MIVKVVGSHDDFIIFDGIKNVKVLPSTLKVAIRKKDQIEFVRDLGIPRPDQAKEPLVSIVMEYRDGKKKMLIFNTVVYLCNDDGKTIDKVIGPDWGKVNSPLQNPKSLKFKAHGEKKFFKCKHSFGPKLRRKSQYPEEEIEEKIDSVLSEAIPQISSEELEKLCGTDNLRCDPNEGFDITYDELNDPSGPWAKALNIIRDIWLSDSPDRETDVRCGTMYFEEAGS